MLQWFYHSVPGDMIIIGVFGLAFGIEASLLN
jgi:hypothetical protein